MKKVLFYVIPILVFFLLLLSQALAPMDGGVWFRLALSAIIAGGFVGFILHSVSAWRNRRK